MYLPLTSALLRWLQLSPFSPLDSDQPALPHLAVPVSEEQLRHPHGSQDLNNLGNFSPYHDAPKFPGLSADLPDDCVVDQVILVSSA